MSQASPRIFQQSGSLAEETHRNVCSVILRRAPHEIFTLRGGRCALVAQNASSVQDLLALGECGDRSCGCSRTNRPWVRPAFYTEISERCKNSEMRGAPIRYLSVGSGALLSDLSVVCTLMDAGITVESITVVDSEYATGMHDAALAQLAAFVAPAPIVAFSSTAALAEACLNGSHLRATVFAHIDASHVARRESRSLAVAALAAGGFAFRLNNKGAVTDATMDCWRRRSDDGATLELALRRQRELLAERPPPDADARRFLLSDDDCDALLETIVGAWPLTAEWSAARLPSSWFDVEVESSDGDATTSTTSWPVSEAQAAQPPPSG